MPLVSVPPLSTNTATLYHRRPPLWARWALVIVAVDVMVVSVTSVIEYTWDIAGLLRSSNAGAINEPVQKDQKDPETKDSLPVQIATHMHMQPVWKKTLFSCLHLAAGVAVAGAVLANRARLLRTVTFTKRDSKTKTPPLIYVQAASHPVGLGFAFPIRDCYLASGATSQMVLQVDELGGWMLNLGGSVINGQKMKAKEYEGARSNMIRLWKDVGGEVVSKSRSNLPSKK
ncbi:hypothetical protein BDZ97DRAFT_1920373 [Flammula alnicola]|nr:hypothetical protein BDZ97DRAFT_1920373 [Flammula alnicola]